MMKILISIVILLIISFALFVPVINIKTHVFPRCMQPPYLESNGQWIDPCPSRQKLTLVEYVKFGFPD